MEIRKEIPDKSKNRTMMLKDSPWEVKEILLPQEGLSASEWHLHPQAMQKKAIKPHSPPLPRG
jgi:hypothetical protein